MGKRVTNSWWHRFNVKRKGRRDGRGNEPHLDSDRSSEFELSLVSLGQQHLEDVRKKFADDIQTKEGKFNGAVQRLERSVTEFQTAFQRYSAKKEELGRDVIIHFRRMWYFVILALIAIGELALNFQAFQVFQKPLLMTFLMALAIAMGLPTCAHFIGILLKQWPRPVWKTAALMLLFTGVGVLCLAGINIARSEYLGIIDVELAAHDEVLESAFLMINLFVFATAVLMSYFAHDSDQDFENAYRACQTADRKCHRISDEILHLGGDIDSLAIRRQSEEKLLQSIINELIYLYRGENQRKRKDAEIPKSFKSNPELPKLDELKQSQVMRSMDDVQKILDKWSNIQVSVPQPIEESGS